MMEKSRKHEIKAKKNFCNSENSRHSLLYYYNNNNSNKKKEIFEAISGGCNVFENVASIIDTQYIGVNEKTSLCKHTFIFCMEFSFFFLFFLLHFQTAFEILISLFLTDILFSTGEKKKK